MDTSPRRLAVLIDAENAQANLIPEIMAEIARLGIASVKRAYGDFTSSHLAKWKDVLIEHSIQGVQQFYLTTNKNAADIALVIDAMDLLHSRRFEGFCIVTSDSDFTRLATRIREEGLVVYGIGARKTPRTLIAACDTFILTENLQRNEPRDAGSSGKAIRAELPPDILAILKDAVEKNADETGWATLGLVGHVLNGTMPDFDARSYGHKNLSSLFGSSKAFFLERRGSEGSNQVVYVKLK